MYPRDQGAPISPTLVHYVAFCYILKDSIVLLNFFQDYVQPKEPDRQEVHHRNEGHVSSPESVLRHKSRDGHTLETIYY